MVAASACCSIRNPQSEIRNGLVIMLPVERSFVILRHTGHGEAHFDLMLEDGPALATWQVEAAPADLPVRSTAAARKLADHRREYLTYEGPVSRGRGRVERMDSGTYELHRGEAGLWDVTLEGSALRGRFELRHVGPAAEDWELRRLSA